MLFQVHFRVKMVLRLEICAEILTWTIKFEAGMVLVFFSLIISPITFIWGGSWVGVSEVWTFQWYLCRV